MIVIDLDGPILDGAARHYACYAEALREAGYTPVSFTEYWRLKRARRDRRALLDLSGAASFYDAFLERWLARIESPPLLALDRVQHGAREVLAAWNAAGESIVLVTARRMRGAALEQLDSLGLRSLFTQVLVAGSSEDGAAKSAVVAAAVPDASDAVACWVGDTEADVLAAKTLRITSVALCCGLRDREYLASIRPDHLFEDLPEMADDRAIDAFRVRT